MCHYFEPFLSISEFYNKAADIEYRNVRMALKNKDGKNNRVRTGKCPLK